MSGYRRGPWQNRRIAPGSIGGIITKRSKNRLGRGVDLHSNSDTRRQQRLGVQRERTQRVVRFVICWQGRIRDRDQTVGGTDDDRVSAAGKVRHIAMRNQRNNRQMQRNKAVKDMPPRPPSRLPFLYRCQIPHNSQYLHDQLGFGETVQR